MDFLLSLTEDQQLIAKWNDTQRPFHDNLSLVDIFRQQVKKTPLAIALDDGKRQINYLQLDKLSNQWAQCIHQHALSGLEGDCFIGLFLERSIETVVAILGVLKAGACYVPFDPYAPKQRLDYILSEIQCPIILTQKSLRYQLADSSAIILEMDGDAHQNQSDAPLLNQIFPDDLAYVIYTSGTTGQPKGVAITHQGIINRLEWMQNQYPLGVGDIVLQKTPYTFDVSVWELLWAHQCGACIFMCKPDGHQDPIYLYEAIQQHHVTVMHFVPSMLNEFCKYLKKNNLKVPRSLKYVFCSGEALLPVHVDMFYTQSEHEVELHNLYGPTEASVDVTYHYCTPNMTKVPIGRPIQNMQIHILNEYLKPTAIGEIGELYIEGVGLAREYIRKEALTRQRFIDWNGRRLYKTGDLACWTKEGVLEYYGRNDFQVKIRGYRIELGEIEQVLSRFADITQTAVLVQYREGEPCLVAYYESPKPMVSSALTKHLKAYLPDYMIPSAFMHMSAFPTTSNGKLCRKSLPIIDFSKRREQIKKPKSTLEKQLCKIWAEALNQSEVYINDDFFFLGGHSLAAARILSSIQKKYKKQIALMDLYESRTIQQLVKVLEKAPKEKNIKIKKEKLSQWIKLPLTDFQLLLWLSEIFEPAAKHINIVTRKRLKGHVDFQLLNQSLNQVIQDQSALNYKISKFFPWQKEAVKSKKGSLFEFQELHEQIEETLSKSMDELIQYNDWSNKQSLVRARGFILPNGLVELQLCLPHLICDETSMRILWDQLSKHYLDLLKNRPTKMKLNASFKDYIIDEQLEHNDGFSDKFKFWENNLQEASLFEFPKEAVVDDMRHSAETYSSYFEIPQVLMDNVKRYCALHHLNYNEVATAALSMVLGQYTQNGKSKNPLINLIKSTRNRAEYDHVMGCMIRVEPIVVSLHRDPNFLELCQSIQGTIAKTSDEQAFSSILKFAFHTNCFKFKKLAHTALVRMGMPLYTWLCGALNIHYLNFKPFHYCWRLAAFDRKNVFLVNLNLWNNLLDSTERGEKNHFDLEPIEFGMVPYELTEIDNLLDVCFIRDHSNHKPYLVLSANLKHAFKTELAQKLFKIFFEL